MAATTKTVLRVNVWSVVDGAAAGDPTRVGCFPTLDEALVAAAGDGGWAPASMWNFNPANKQIWRHNDAGDRLYAIKRIPAAALEKVAANEGAALEAELAEAAAKSDAALPL